MVAAVIVNYEAGEMLAEAVASALGPADLVVVVDNASADGSVGSVLRKFGGDPRVRVVRRAANGGFAVGCNEGVRALGPLRADGPAGSDLVLFLNPDARCLPGCVEALAAELRAGPRNGLAGGVPVDAEGREQGGGRRAVPTPRRAFVRATGLWRLARRFPGLLEDFHLDGGPMPAGPVDVEAVSGSLMMARADALADVGPMDEGYFLHCEDLDWCMAFRARGWRIRFVPAARAWHAHGGCSRSSRISVELHKHRGMARFHRKHFARGPWDPLGWAVTAGVWARFAAKAAAIGVSSPFSR